MSYLIFHNANCGNLWRVLLHKMAQTKGLQEFSTVQKRYV